MKKLAISSLLVSFFCCYLEWGGGNSSFVFEAVYSALFKQAWQIEAFLHPFVLLPMLGVGALLFTLFQKEPNRRLVLAGLAATGVLVLMLLVVGLLSRNLKIILFTLPYCASAVWCLRLFWRKHQP